MDQQDDRRKWGFKCAVVAIVALLTAWEPLAAATQIRGQQDDMQVSIQNALIKEVLDALSTNFNLTYRLPSNSNRNISGVYTGTLYRVLARILDGNDYVVEVSDGAVKVVVFGASGSTVTPPTRQLTAAIENVAVASQSPSSAAASTLPSPSSSPPPLSTYLSAKDTEAADQGINRP